MGAVNDKACCVSNCCTSDANVAPEAPLPSPEFSACDGAVVSSVALPSTKGKIGGGFARHQPASTFEEVQASPQTALSMPSLKLQSLLEERAAKVRSPMLGKLGDPLNILFRTADGSLKSCTFVVKPLGFTFQNVYPLTVLTVDAEGQAWQLGVEVGWEFKEIAGKEVVGWQEAAMRVIDFARALPERRPGPHLGITCESETETKVVYFRNKPLGLVFAPTDPLVISNMVAESQAERLGVESGTRVVFVALRTADGAVLRVDVNAGSRDEIVKEIVRLAEVLPEQRVKRVFELDAPLPPVLKDGKEKACSVEE